MPARRILIVAPISPPATLSAAHRIAGLTKYLSRLGHDITVVTSVVSGSGPVSEAARTVRTRDLMVSPVNWRRANFEALANTGHAGYDPAPSALASVVVPDLELIGWLPFACAQALRLARTIRPECVITSSPPHSGHLVGLALQARGVPWLADFRDGWTFEPTRPRYPFSGQRRLDAFLERLVATRADAVVGVTPPITEDLQRRFGCQAVTVTNGFDPEESTGPTDWWSPLAQDRRSLVYTGSLSYAGNSPRSLLRALDLLTRERPQLGARLEMVFAGPTTATERDELSRRAPLVRSLGRLPRNRTLALQRAADGLILIAGDQRPSVATSKLYEYLASNRPILVLGAASVAARIVETTGSGEAVPADDTRRIAEALARLAERKEQTVGADRHIVLRRYGYPSLAREMAAQVEVAIAARRRQS
jgi:glycosyltransferase involved in cell wall biosynthesis